jgi:hypothetical protein
VLPGCAAPVAAAAALVGLVVAVVSTISVCLNKLPLSLSAQIDAAQPHPSCSLRERDPPHLVPLPPTFHSASTSSVWSLHLQIRAPTELLDFRHRLHELVIPWDLTMSSSFYHRRRLSEHQSVARRDPLQRLRRPACNQRYARLLHPTVIVYDASTAHRRRAR